MRPLTVVLLSALVAGQAGCARTLRSTIRSEAIGGKCLPVLTQPVQEALYSYEPTFELWRPPSGQCADTTYGLSEDFNSDGKIDVALNGRTRLDAVILVVLSNSTGYQVQDALREHLVRADGVREDWTTYFLDPVKPGTYEPSCTTGDSVPRLHLTSNAFSVNMDDKSSIIVYYRAGRISIFPWATC